MADRITPAYAGKTSEKCCKSGKSEDHPRVCGENEEPSFKLRFTSGSPPRMRGKPVGKFLAGQDHRITPAYAGKTRFRR